MRVQKRIKFRRGIDEQQKNKKQKKNPETIEESIMFNSENSNTTKETDNKNSQ